MSGYNWAAGMSNNAVAAYQSGLVPASKIKGVPAALVEQFCTPSEWHHASKAFKCVNFYDPDHVRGVFGLEASEEANAEAIVALNRWKKSKKSAAVVHADCVVEWLEWSGSLSRPTCIERRETGCTVSVKGQTATVTLPGGAGAAIFTKRLSTRGFKFDSRALLEARLAGHGYSADEIAAHPLMAQWKAVANG